MIGKVIIRPDYSLVPSLYKNEKHYKDFVVGYDEDGNEVSYACDPSILEDNEKHNPKAPTYLTRVFFRKEVLAKYYDNPKKYKVHDNSIHCGGLWILRLDLNHPDYVIAFLGDLGRDLPEGESKHWKTYNISPPPDVSLSGATMGRWFKAEWTNPDSVDLLFKQKFERFQKDWFENKGWHLFKPLTSEDQHHFTSLHIPLSDNQKEFDEQLNSLAKCLIDSLNDSELKKRIEFEDGDKSITKLEKFLLKNDISCNCIPFLRGLWNIRSKLSAHRKDSDISSLEVIENELGIEEEFLYKAFESILAMANAMLTDLHIVLNNEREQNESKGNSNELE